APAAPKKTSTPPILFLPSMHRLGIAAFLGISLLIKSYHLALPSLSADEVFSVYVAQFSPAEIISYLRQGNNSPLYEVILHYWQRWRGIEENAVRWLSVGAMSLAGLFFVLSLKRFISLSAAWVGALLFLFSSYTTEYAQIARAYSFLSLGVTASVYTFLRFWKEEKLYWGILWVCATLWASHVHYFGL
ncbi:MAG: hypothetical protein ACUVRD_07610, partial [Bacteroidia bacterium]